MSSPINSQGLLTVYLKILGMEIKGNCRDQYFVSHPASYNMQKKKKMKEDKALSVLHRGEEPGHVITSHRMKPVCHTVKGICVSL